MKKTSGGIESELKVAILVGWLPNIINFQDTPELAGKLRGKNPTQALTPAEVSFGFEFRI